ncbi:MAG: DeoR/GlpR transcriptional regulator [Oscillospiraceae bacterium]|jgi:DeoR/GlpR family transcriptional regulator of sugar metabolism|nr:DeoR/GlpR transcriptional regulator [Oscillospiraceae bacterium]
MLNILRQEEIMAVLRDRKSATVQELAELLFASGSTIRRDLAELERVGMIRRSHGGAVLFEGGGEAAAVVREQQHPKEKKRAAETAFPLLRRGAAVFLDSSSTVGMLVPLLGRLSDLVVVTNGLNNAMMLAEKPGIQVAVACGSLRKGSNSVVGSDTAAYLAGIHPDFSVMSCSAVNEEGFFESSFEQRQLKRQMLQNARVRIIICDSSKFGLKSLAALGDFSAADYLASDQPPPEEIAKAAEKAGCKLLFP